MKAVRGAATESPPTRIRCIPSRPAVVCDKSVYKGDIFRCVIIQNELDIKYFSRNCCLKTFVYFGNIE
jgi:hypothetical protein